MILVREVFQAKYGHGDELVALFKEMNGMGITMRVMTDASGPFFTIVTEHEVESLGAWEKQNAEMFSGEGNRDFGAWFGRMMAVTESGSREFYNIVS